MGAVKEYPPCLQIVAAFSQYDSAFDWLWNRIAVHYSPIVLLSPRFDFHESKYYRPTMGERLMKQIAILADWYDPGQLACDKLQCHRWESEMASSLQSDVSRPLNIDPGYMTMTKLVLASTKNREHRVYLRDGIYAEVTLAFRNQQWVSFPWTYPDYQREDFRVFFEESRKHLAKNVAALLRSRSATSAMDPPSQ